MTREVDYKIVDVLLSTGLLSKDSRQQSTFHDCVHELSSLPMSRLSSEPAYLRDCHKTVLRDSHKWAYENYDVFIQTAECTREIFDDFEKVQTMDDSLTNKIPDLLDAGHKFIEECRQLMTHASMNSLTLQKHNQILEVLEIPQLLEACIRNNYLDEALELIAHCRKLERRLGHIPIISNVTQEARSAAQKLLQQLFQQLGAELQLPSCLKIVGYLRRMDCLPESLLRLKFLQCRDNYLLGLLRSLASNDPFYHATKYMEVTRVNLFDIATQYRAVFNDEDLYLSNNDSLGQQHVMLFSSWLVMRVDVFITSLAVDINIIIDNSLSYNQSMVPTQSTSQSVGSKLQSLLGQSMYFGLSLSRIGSDFRPLLLPVFYQAVMKFIEMKLMEIADSFTDCISNYKWTVNIEDLNVLTLREGLAHSQQKFLLDRSEEIVAPVKLMNHPLLALLLNQMCSVLEDIRLCCPRVLKKRICYSFVDTVKVVIKSLLKFHVEEGPNFSTKEQQSFLNMIMALLVYFVPHLDLCLGLLFTSEEFLAKSGDCMDVRTLTGLFSDLLPASFFATFNEDENDMDDNEEDVRYKDDVKENQDISENESIMLMENKIVMSIQSNELKESDLLEDHDHQVVDSDDHGKDEATLIEDHDHKVVDSDDHGKNEAALIEDQDHKVVDSDDHGKNEAALIEDHDHKVVDSDDHGKDGMEYPDDKVLVSNDECHKSGKEDALNKCVNGQGVDDSNKVRNNGVLMEDKKNKSLEGDDGLEGEGALVEMKRDTIMESEEYNNNM